MSPELIRLIEIIEEHVREAALVSEQPAAEDTIKKNLRLLNVIMTGADKDFINLLPDTNKPEAKLLFNNAREVFSLYIEVYNQYLADRMQGVPEENALEMAKETMQEEQKPLHLQ